MKKCMLLSVDDILLDRFSAMKEVFSTSAIDFRPESVETMSFDGDIGCDKEKALEISDAYTTWTKVKPYENVVSNLSLLKKRYNITAFYRASTSLLQATKKSSLVGSIGLSGSPNYRRRTVVDVDKYDIVVDTDLDFLIAVSESDNIECVLIDAPYNEKRDLPSSGKIQRYSSFNEFCKVVCNEEKCFA